jgi:hypothetical protein
MTAPRRTATDGALLSPLTSLQVYAPLSYLIAVVLPALDAIFPVPPSETAVIALGVATAGSANSRTALLIALRRRGRVPRRQSLLPHRPSLRALGGTQVLRQRQRRA